MTTNHHTPIPNGSAANASTINNPLSELDAELTAQDERIGTLEGDMPVPSGSPTEYYDGNGNWTVPVGTGNSIDGHVIKNDGVSLPQRASIDFVGNGVRVTNETGGTQIEIPGTVNIGIYNYLSNGGFDFAQRQDPATLTTIAQDKYSADRWRVSRENDDLQYQRADGLGETGLTSQYFGTFKKITNSGKFAVYQVIEGINSVALRGKAVTFQAQMKASSSKVVRMAVLELQNAGTINVIPSTFVSAWGANSTDPIFGSNVAIITAAQSKNVTTSMQTFSVSVTVPVNSKNLICAFWTDSQFAANDTLSIAEVGLRCTGDLQGWTPRLLSAELQLCYRHCVSWGGNNNPVTGGYAYNSTTAIGSVALPVEMMTAPTLTTSLIAGDFVIERQSSVIGCSVTPTLNIVGTRNVEIVFTVASGLIAGEGLSFFISSPSARIVLESDF